MTYKKSHPELNELCSAQVRFLARALRKHPVQIIEEAINRMYQECDEVPAEPTFITEDVPERERLL